MLRTRLCSHPAAGRHSTASSIWRASAKSVPLRRERMSVCASAMALRWASTVEPGRSPSGLKLSVIRSSIRTRAGPVWSAARRAVPRSLEDDVLIKLSIPRYRARRRLRVRRRAVVARTVEPQRLASAFPALRGPVGCRGHDGKEAGELQELHQARLVEMKPALSPHLR